MDGFWHGVFVLVVLVCIIIWAIAYPYQIPWVFHAIGDVLSWVSHAAGHTINCLHGGPQTPGCGQ